MSAEIKAGGAYVELKVRDKMKQGLDEAKSRLSSFGALLTSATGGFLGSLAAFSVSGIMQKMGEVLNQADAIADTGSRLGLTAEEYQRLAHAADQNASSVQELGVGLLKFNRLLGSAEMGSKAAREKLEKYGLSLEKLATMSPEEKLAAVADVIKSIEDPALRTAAAMELMGRSGAMLVPLLGQGGDAIRALGRQADALGLVAKESDIQRQAALADVYATLQKQAGRVSGAIYNALVPAFEQMAYVTRGVLAATIKIIDENPVFVQSVFAVGAAVGLATSAAVLYQAAMMGASIVMPLFTAATYAAQAALMALNASFVLNPFGAIVAGILAAAAGVLYFSGSLDGLGAIFGKTFGGIIDAIQGGSLGLAWEIAVDGLYLAWVKFTENMVSAFESVAARVSEVLRPIQERIVEMSQGLNAITGGLIPEIKNQRKTSPSNNQQERESAKLERELDAKLRKAEEARKLLFGDTAKSTETPKFDVAALLDQVKSTQPQKTFTTPGYFSSGAAGMLPTQFVSFQKQQIDLQKKANATLETIAENTEEEEPIFN